ncbi:MAG: hypothetical protein ACO1NO_09175 [Burkholderiaceae bacterium]
MKARPILITLSVLIASLLLIGASHVHAAGNAAEGTTGTAAPIYGSQMMTPEERDAYQQKMRDAKTFEEREKIRAEHHEAMQTRAKERGMSLPDAPPGRGPGMGPGRGPGAGPGMGMGPGGGPGAGRGGGRNSP